MANNVAVTAGSGTSVATDDVSSVHYQVVKIAHGADGTADWTSAVDPFPVEIISGEVGLAASEEHVGGVGGSSVLVTPTVTISTSIYAAGDVIGDELTLTNAMRVSSGSGVLHSIAVFDADNEKAAFDILLFESDPAGTYTDNAAASWNTADFAKFLGRVNVATTDYLTVNSRALAVKTGIGLTVKASGSRNLYAVLIATGTPTYTATTDLTLRFGFLQD